MHHSSHEHVYLMLTVCPRMLQLSTKYSSRQVSDMFVATLAWTEPGVASVLCRSQHPLRIKSQTRAHTCKLAARAPQNRDGHLSLLNWPPGRKCPSSAYGMCSSRRTGGAMHGAAGKTP